MSATATAISIRPARVDDAAALTELSRQLGYPTDLATMSRRLARVRDARVGEVFVAVDEQAVIGWTHVVPRLQLEEVPFAELAGLVVADGARGSGAGAKLLQAAESWAAQQGFELLRVRSNVIRERAHRFYLREGYAERKRQVVFEKPLK